MAFDQDGQELARYRKIHLFDVTTPDGRSYRESDTFGAGDAVITYQAEDITVGCSICYDLRFGEFYQALAAAGANVIMVLAAFTLQTGKDHWEVLLRARSKPRPMSWPRPRPGPISRGMTNAPVGATR